MRKRMGEIISANQLAFIKTDVYMTISGQASSTEDQQ
jgi:hypothetical protein